MPKLITVCSVFFLTLAILSAEAQTANDIISKYLTALGGKAQLNSIQTLYMEGVATMQDGNEITTKLYKVNGKLYRREAKFGDIGGFTTIVTNTQGWFTNPRNEGAFEPLPEERVQAQQPDLDCAGPLVDYVKKGHRATLLGKALVDGKNCFKVKLTLKTGQDMLYYFDPATGYLVRESRKGGAGVMGGGGRRPEGGVEGEVQTDYSNYRKTAEGYVFPFTVDIGAMGGSITFQKIEVNKPVDEKALSQPAE
jgi:hypothetical protein